MNGELWALFASALISSTLLPGGSEALLLWLADAGRHPGLVLLAVATAGNTLGSLITFALGWWLASRWPAERLAPRQQRALGWLRRHGQPALLLAWLPLVGDPLCLVAGWLRMQPVVAATMILTGKLLRYAALLGLLDLVN